MMLLFRDRGWDVMTSSWTVGAKSDKEVVLVYTWGGDGIGWSQSSVSTAQIKLAMSFSDFMDRVASAAGGIVDLRKLR